MSFFVRDRSFYRRYFSMLGFIALQNLLIFALNLMDNVMLGAYAEAAMSGASLANQIQFLLSMIIGGIGDGVSVLCAQYWGQKQTTPIKRLIAVALRVGLCFALFFTAVSVFIPSHVLGLFSSDAEIIAQGSEYMRMLGISFIFFTTSGILLRVHQSVENVTLGYKVTTTSLLMNIGLNYVFIFGKLGFPEMGAVGAALATLISRISECLIILYYTVKRDQKLKARLSDFIQIDKLIQKDFFTVALPVILSGTSWGVAMCLQTAILGHLGASAVGANAIATTLFQVITVVCYASATAASVMTGTAVGKGDLTHIKPFTRTFQAIFLAIGLFSFLCLQGFRIPILSLYEKTISPDTYRLAYDFIGVLSITVVGTAYQASCLTGIVRGGGNTKFVLFNDLIFMWGLILPASVLCAFVFNLSPMVVFICLKSDQILKCAVAAVHVNSYRWIKKVTRDVEAAQP